MGFRSDIRQAIGQLLRNQPPVPATAAPPSTGRTDAATTASGRTSFMGSIYNTLTGLGGMRDKGSSAQPNVYRSGLALEELSALYAYNGYAARIVDQLADDATRKGWRIEDDTDDAEPLAAEFKRLSARRKLADGLRWGRLYGKGGVLIVTDEGLGADLAAPIDLDRLRRVKNLVPLDVYGFSACAFEGEPGEPNYGEPKEYNVHPPFISTHSFPRVHASRLLYFPGKRLPPNLRWRGVSGGDLSILDGAWDAVRNLTTIDQGGAAVAQELNVNVVKVGNNRGMQASDMASSYLARIELMAKSISALNMLVMDTDEEFARMGAAVTGWGELTFEARLALAAVSGMPQTLLFGETPGGLNTDGESHRRIWDAVVEAYDEYVLRENIEWLARLLYRQKEGPTAGAEPDEWKLHFNSRDVPTEKDLAELEKLHAETDAIRIQSGVVAPEDATRSRFGPQGYQNHLLPVELDEEREPGAEAEADVRRLLEGGAARE